MNIFFSFLTVIVLFFIGFLLSEDKRNIKLRPILGSLCLEIVLIAFMLKTAIGEEIVSAISNCVVQIINFGDAGIKFVFGDLATNYFTFGINVLGLVCFISALLALLMYLRITQLIVKVLGGIVSKVLGVSQAEAICVISDGFLGATEAPLIIKSYIKDMSRSELYCILTGGFVGISVTVIAGYSLLGIPLKYLLTAMAVTPFATIMIAKLIIPAKEVDNRKVEIPKSEASNAFEAISTGAINGMQMSLSIGAVLIAFLGLIAGINFCLGYFGLSLQVILGYVFMPLAYLLHIPATEIHNFTSLIGLKVATNEFVGFTAMSKLIPTMSPRVLAMLSVALCNFANISVIALSTGAYSILAPSRAKEVSKLGWKALVGAILATLITTTLVGMFF